MLLEPLSADYLVRHSRLVTADLDEARENVSRLWEYHTSWLRRGRNYGIRWHQATIGGAQLCYIRSPVSIHVACGPISDRVYVTLQERGRIAHRVNGCRAVSTAACAVVHAPGSELELDTEPFSLLLLSFEATAVANALAAAHGRPPALAALPCEFSLKTASGLALRSLSRWAARELDRLDAPIATCPKAAEGLGRTLLSLFLSCVAEGSEQIGQKVDAQAKARLDAAEAWMRAHLTEPVGIADIARAAGMSVRTLEMTFRRYRGCTPAQCLRQLRLEAAQRLLRNPHPTLTVTGAAVETGFFHLGRFSASYKARFGESPSLTLKRARQAKA
jgi:AraC-like DNA-binding protein